MEGKMDGQHNEGHIRNLLLKHQWGFLSGVFILWRGYYSPRECTILVHYKQYSWSVDEKLGLLLELRQSDASVYSSEWFKTGPWKHQVLGNWPFQHRRGWNESSEQCSITAQDLGNGARKTSHWELWNFLAMSGWSRKHVDAQCSVGLVDIENQIERQWQWVEGV